MVVNQIVIVLDVKPIFSLSDGSSLGIANEVIVNNSGRVDFVLLSFVGYGADQKHIFGLLPHGVNGAFNFVHVVRQTDFVLILEDMEGSLGVISQIKSSELKLFIMPGFEPADHGVVIGSPDDVFVGPFVVFRLVDVEGLISRHGWVVVVGKFEPIVIVSAVLPDTQILGIGKSLNISLIRLLIKELMLNVSEFMSLKVQNGNSVLSSLNIDRLSIAKHPKSIHQPFEEIFEEYLSILVTVHQHILSNSLHSHENKSVIEGCVQVQKFGIVFLQFDMSLVDEKHEQKLDILINYQHELDFIKNSFIKFTLLNHPSIKCIHFHKQVIC